MAPPRPESRFHRLPPILHRQIQNSVQSYSKGSRGLSVLPRVHCIFTAISTSLSLGSRQWGQRYAIRAGRNLPDKEFRSTRMLLISFIIFIRNQGDQVTSPCMSPCRSDFIFTNLIVGVWREVSEDSGNSHTSLSC